MFYNKFTAYRARLERLYGFLLSTEEQHSARQPEISEVSDGIALECKAAAAFARIGGSLHRRSVGNCISFCTNLSPFNGLLNGDYLMPLKVVRYLRSELINQVVVVA